MNTFLNTVIVDDEKICRDGLLFNLKEFKEIKIIAEFSDENKLFSFLNSNDIDLIFLDIDLGESSGFEVSRTIKDLFPNVMIIFVTGHSDFAMEGYDHEPIDFISKPIRYSRLQKSIQRAKKTREKLTKYKELKITVQNGNGFDVVKISDITYLDKVEKKVHLHCVDGRIIESFETIKKWEKELREYRFFKCHQSFIISLDKIKSIKVDNRFHSHSYYIELENLDKRIPLSRKYYKELKGLFV